MNITLLVDHFSREGLIGAMLAQLLAPDHVLRCDHQDIYLSEQGYDYFDRAREPADLMITPSYNVRNTKHVFSRAVRANAPLVVQHSEQLYPGIFRYEKLNIDRLSQYNDDVFAHIVWGENYARRIREECGVPADRIYICGNPKLDIASTSANMSAQSLAPDDGEHRPLVLFISNYLLADLTDDELRAFFLKHKVHTDIPMNRELKRFREKTVAWIRDAARRFPEVTFLVRPHPGESDEPYAEALQEENVVLSARGEFSEDLARADLVTMHSSSSIFEVLVTGRDALSLDVGKLPSELIQPPSEIFHWISKDQFLAAIQQVVNGVSGTAPSEQRMRHLDECMHDPFTPSIPKHAAAYAHLCKRISAGEWPGYTSRQRMRARLSEFTPLAKNAFIAGGRALKSVTGVDNPITRFASARWAARSGAGNIVNDEMWASALDVAEKKQDQSDCSPLSKVEETMKLTENGWKVQGCGLGADRKSVNQPVRSASS